MAASNQFNPQDIEAIDIHVDKGHLRVCNIQEPKSGLEAKFSLRLTAAMALCDLDTASIELFDEDFDEWLVNLKAMCEFYDITPEDS